MNKDLLVKSVKISALVTVVIYVIKHLIAMYLVAMWTGWDYVFEILTGGLPSLGFRALRFFIILTVCLSGVLVLRQKYSTPKVIEAEKK